MHLKDLTLLGVAGYRTLAIQLISNHKSFDEHSWYGRVPKEDPIRFLFWSLGLLHSEVVSLARPLFLVEYLLDPQKAARERIEDFIEDSQNEFERLIHVHWAKGKNPLSCWTKTLNFIRKQKRRRNERGKKKELLLRE